MSGLLASLALIGGLIVVMAILGALSIGLIVGLERLRERRLKDELLPNRNRLAHR
jgi:hypothetical protein